MYITFHGADEPETEPTTLVGSQPWADAPVMTDGCTDGQLTLPPTHLLVRKLLKPCQEQMPDLVMTGKTQPIWLLEVCEERRFASL